MTLKVKLEHRWAKTILLYGLLFFHLLWGLNADQKRLWTGFKHHVTFTQVSVDQGLSHNSVLCIMQDGDGFMWFGTEDGLNRYDGKEFIVFHPDPADPASISNNIIQSVYEDRSGVIWVGTSGGGLNRFHRETGTFEGFRFDPGDPSGIGSNDINDIFEDSQNRLWICTNNGLNRLNRGEGAKGKPTFRAYVNDPQEENSLSGNVVVRIYEDKTGTLWLGTAGGGLNRLDFKDGNPDAPVFKRYRSATHAPGHPGLDYVQGIREDADGLMWVGTQEGLFSFHRETETFTPYYYSSTDPHSIGHNYIRMLYKDRAGVLWIATDGGGLNKLVPGDGKEAKPTFVRYQKTNQPNSLNGNGVESIYEDRSGVLWVGVYHGGLNKLVFTGTQGLNREKEQFIHYQHIPSIGHSLSHNFVNAMAEDNAGGLWIGTDGGGLNRAVLTDDPEMRVRFEHHRHDPANIHSPGDNIITTILKDSTGAMWFGTYTGGLDKLSVEELTIIYNNTSHDASEPKGRKPRFKHYRNVPGDPRSLNNNFIGALLEDKQGTLWVGTVGGGLNRYHRDSDDFTAYRFDENKPDGLIENNIFSLYQDRQGNIWIGTVEGLDRMVPPADPEGAPTFFHHVHSGEPGSLSHNFVRVIHQDAKGRLWIGTNGGGLNLLLKDDADGTAKPTFKYYGVKDGLPNNVILGILEDDSGMLWLSTNKGLSRFDPEGPVFKNYDVRDGLQSDEFCRGSYYKNAYGEMFFGGNNGFNVFHPDNIMEYTPAPPIVITGFTVLNKPVPIGERVHGKKILDKSITYTDAIVLSHKDYVFSFRFAALDYVNPSRNRYAYMMEGLDRDWNEVENRSFAGYTTLEPGNYVFRVRGSNSDGIWNREGVKLAICITPPFWKTWWFYALMALVLLMTLLGFHIYRVRQLINRERRKYEKTSLGTEKADEYLKRLLEFVEREKPYLNTDITLHKLAKMIDIPYHSLSQIINHKLNKIFFDFINHYRIEEAVKQLSDTTGPQKNIQQIAGEVGFNSQSAFNRAFKKHTEQTPSDFINQYRIEEAVRKLTDPEEKKKNIQQIANEAGFSSQSAFNRAFKKTTGKTPSEFKKSKAALKGKRGQKNG